MKKKGDEVEAAYDHAAGSPKRPCDDKVLRLLLLIDLILGMVAIGVIIVIVVAGPTCEKPGRSVGEVFCDNAEACNGKQFKIKTPAYPEEMTLSVKFKAHPLNTLPVGNSTTYVRFKTYNGALPGNRGVSILINLQQGDSVANRLNAVALMCHRYTDTVVAPNSTLHLINFGNYKNYEKDANISVEATVKLTVRYDTQGKLVSAYLQDDYGSGQKSPNFATLPSNTTCKMDRETLGRAESFEVYSSSKEPGGHAAAYIEAVQVVAKEPTD